MKPQLYFSPNKPHRTSTLPLTLSLSSQTADCTLSLTHRRVWRKEKRFLYTRKFIVLFVFASVQITDSHYQSITLSLSLYFFSVCIDRSYSHMNVSLHSHTLSLFLSLYEQQTWRCSGSVKEISCNRIWERVSTSVPESLMEWSGVCVCCGLALFSFIVCAITHSFTHSLIHSFTHSLTHSFTHSLTHSFIHSFTHSHIHSFTHSFTHSLTHTHTHTLPHTASPPSSGYATPTRAITTPNND